MNVQFLQDTRIMLRSICGTVLKENSPLSLQIYFKRYSQSAAINLNNKAATSSSLEDGDKEEILHFFNHCDHVTLRKLIGLNPKFYKDIDTEKVIGMGEVSRRYGTIDSLLTASHIKTELLADIAMSMRRLKKREESTFGIKNLYPQFPVQNIKYVDKVVSLDVFQEQITWTVQKPDRTVTDMRSETLFTEINFKHVYDHISHTSEISRVLDMIPVSNVYLFSSRQQKVTKSNFKYHTSQALMEALLMTSLNLRRSNSADFSDVVNSLYSDENYTEKETKRLENSVYMFKETAFAEFYNNVMQGELLQCRDVVERWRTSKDGPLEGLYMDLELEELFRTTKKQEQLAKCLLMSDMFCKCLIKPRKAFPRSYSYY